MSIYAQRGNRMQPFLPVIPRSTQLSNFFFQILSGAYVYKIPQNSVHTHPTESFPSVK